MRGDPNTPNFGSARRTPGVSDGGDETPSGDCGDCPTPGIRPRRGVGAFLKRALQLPCDGYGCVPLSRGRLGVPGPCWRLGGRRPARVHERGALLGVARPHFPFPRGRLTPACARGASTHRTAKASRMVCWNAASASKVEVQAVAHKVRHGAERRPGRDPAGDLSHPRAGARCESAAGGQNSDCVPSIRTASSSLGLRPSNSRMLGAIWVVSTGAVTAVPPAAPGRTTRIGTFLSSR